MPRASRLSVDLYSPICPHDLGLLEGPPSLEWAPVIGMVFTAGRVAGVGT